MSNWNVWKRISFVWLRVKTGIWIKEEEDLARFESNNTFFDDFRFKRESLKSIIGTISRMKRAFGRKGKKAQLSITFFINRYPTSSISSTNGNTMDALEKNQTKLSSFRWISRFATLWVDFLPGDVKKKKRRRIFILFWPIYDRFFVRVHFFDIERRHASRWRIFLSLLYFPSSNITAEISFNFNESLKFVKRMNSNYIYGVFNSSKKEACFKGRR